MTQTISLPEWASFKTDEDGNQVLYGTSLVIDVDAHAMYPALLEEYRALYRERTPAEWHKADGDLKKEWADALTDLASDEPSAYWLEVCYQSMKLELQVACRTFALNIHVHDEGKLFAQADRDDGRGPDRAAGGLGGGKEAREHYKRLRGFLPA